MKRSFLVVLLVLCIGGMEALGSVGVGAKLLNGSIPFIVVELGGESLSAELGAGFQTMSLMGLANLTMIWYSGIARVAFPMGALAPYLGAGAVGVSVIVSSDLLDGSDSGSVFGVAGEAGLRYSLVGLGLPLRVYGGASLNWFPAAGLLGDLGISSVGLGWHIGVVVLF
jgi:hypothetical protein